jgi:hypothetical protein
MTPADPDILTAEVVALQAVLISVFRTMARERPDLAPIFCTAFDEAETILTGVADKMGLEAPLESTVGALAVIEEIRRAVIPDESICRDPAGA